MRVCKIKPTQYHKQKYIVYLTIDKNSENLQDGLHIFGPKPLENHC